MKKNDKRIYLNLNPNHETKGTKKVTQRLKQKIRNVQNQNTNNFYYNEINNVNTQ
jgi:hypothetical protein